MLDFQTTILSRQSIREFLPEPLSQVEIRAALEDAQWSLSACNIQPWSVHIVSGEKLVLLKNLMKEKLANGEFTSDFAFDQNQFTGELENRWRSQYAHVFSSFGITREDKEGRNRVMLRNTDLYDAPHVALLTMPAIEGNEVIIAADVGIYSQSLMLSLTAHGFGSIPMLMPALFAQDIRQLIGVPDGYKLLHVLAFGRPNWDAQPNKNTLVV